MKKPALILLTFLILSCSKETIHFQDLTNYDDYQYIVKVWAENPDEVIDFRVITEETNSYGKLVTYSRSYSLAGGEKSYTRMFAVKAYKRNGVKVIPEGNVGAVLVRLTTIGAENSLDWMIFQHLSDSDSPIFVGYDFDTEENRIEYLSE